MLLMLSILFWLSFALFIIHSGLSFFGIIGQYDDFGNSLGVVLLTSMSCTWYLIIIFSKIISYI